jgi:hypothetical protein
MDADEKRARIELETQRVRERTAWIELRTARFVLATVSIGGFTILLERLFKI